MDELVKMAMEREGFVAEIDTEWIENSMDYVLVSIIKELRLRGIAPTVRLVIDEINGLADKDPATLVRHFKQRMEVIVERDETYMAAVLREDFNKRALFSMFAEGPKKLRTESSEEIVAWIREESNKVAIPSKMADMRSTLKETISMLTDIYDGKTEPYWKTGSPSIDVTTGLYKRMLLMIAAQQKIGKTRFTCWLILQLLKNKPDLRVIWYPLEMHPSEVLVCMIANMTNINTRVITGKARMPTAEERDMIINAQAALKEYDLRFIKQNPTMGRITRDVERLSKDNDTVTIIDNMGLVQNDKGLDDLRFENECAKALVSLRDSSDSLILTLHHLSPESEGHHNKADMYEPETKHVRGSNKWADSVNAMWLLHRPDHYKKLAATMSPEHWAALQGLMVLKMPIAREAPAEMIRFGYDLGTCRFEDKGLPK